MRLPPPDPSAERPIRVAHVITRLIVGGAQENTLVSVAGLRRTPGYAVRLLSGPTGGPEGSLEAWIAGQPEVLVRIPALVRPVAPLRDAVAYRQLRSWFREWRPAIVHTHSGKAGVLGRLAAARESVPIIVHTIHGPSFGPFQGRVANAIFTAAERRAGRVTTHFVGVAQAMIDQYLRAGIGTPGEYTRIFSGFELGPFLEARNDLAERARLGIPEDAVVVGTVARLFALKGHDAILDAGVEWVRRCPRVRFLWVGDGAWRGRLEQRARALGLADRIVLTGLVAPEQVPRYIGLMDVLVHLSTREGLARALPQALAAGRPVVALDCDGAREVCHNNETGFLVPVGDRMELIRAVVRLCEDAALRARFGEAGRARVQAEFSAETMVSRLIELYARLVEAREPRRTPGVAR